MNAHLLAQIALIASALLVWLRYSMNMISSRVHRRREEAAMTQADLHARALLQSIMDRSRRNQIDVARQHRR